MAQSPLEMKIRPAKPGDGSALHQLFQRSVSALAAQAYSAAQIDAWLSRLDSERFEHRILQTPFFVAEGADGEMLGFSALNGDSRELEYVYVDPAFARQGVGALLVAEAAKSAKALDLDSIFVVASLNAVPFYERIGFKRDKFLVRVIEGVQLGCVRMVMGI